MLVGLEWRVDFKSNALETRPLSLGGYKTRKYMFNKGKIRKLYECLELKDTLVA